MVATSAPEIAMSMMNVITTPEAAGGGGAAALALSLRDKACGSGGNVDFDEGQPAGSYLATITNCADENAVINGTVSGTYGATIPCGAEDLPTSVTSTFNGTIVIDGQTFTFTAFRFDADPISYGLVECNLDGGSFNSVLNGSITTTKSGETIGINFQDFVLNVLTISDPDGLPNGIGRTVTLTMDGMATISTPCKTSGLMTIATVSNITIAQPNVCPTGGQINVTGDFGATTHTFNGTCDDTICVLDF
ncbi:MAG: hypothetical protein IME96_07075 [Proteobacteria bacterium]|nr:hypothetical protein [Pseudomonadota bacterium]